jgi:hypothetical protein
MLSLSPPKTDHLRSSTADRIAALVTMLPMLFALSGCGTTNQRTGTEQMLMSDAVDMSISRIDFRPLAGQRAYLDTTYIRPTPLPACRCNWLTPIT